MLTTSNGKYCNADTSQVVKLLRATRSRFCTKNILNFLFWFSPKSNFSNEIQENGCEKGWKFQFWRQKLPQAIITRFFFHYFDVNKEYIIFIILWLKNGKMKNSKWTKKTQRDLIFLRTSKSGKEDNHNVLPHNTSIIRDP